MAKLSFSAERVSFTADDGTVVTGEEAKAAFDVDVDMKQQLRQRAAREHPREWAEYCRARGYVDAPPVRTSSSSVPQGRAPREARNDRHRGSRRGDHARSSSSDDPDPEPEPRTCECGCGASLEGHRANKRYLTPAHKARHHRAVSAERQLVRSDAQLDLATPSGVRACLCGGATFKDPEGDLVCASCARFADPSQLAAPNGWDARLAEFSFLATHRWDGDVWVRIYEHQDRPDPPGNDGGLQTRLRGERRRRFSAVRYDHMPATRSAGHTTKATPVVAGAAERRTQ